ncbi:MAG UNVERIFIED_CONTAM: hypothetical protein LVT10_07165 [Anaerolineae bacterium]
MADYDDFVEVASAPWLANREGITRLEAWERIQPSAVVIVEGYPPHPMRRYARMSPKTVGSVWHVGRESAWVMLICSCVPPSPHSIPYLSISQGYPMTATASAPANQRLRQMDLDSVARGLRRLNLLVFVPQWEHHVG